MPTNHFPYNKVLLFNKITVFEINFAEDVLVL